MEKRQFLASALMVVALFLSTGSGLAWAPGAVPRSTALALPWVVEMVDPGGRMGAYVSVVVDLESGTTWISYFDTQYDDLRVARHVGSGGNCGPANTWNCEVVDASVQGGQYSSIAIDLSTGLPSVAYHDATRGDLRYAAHTCDGSCSWAVYTIDPGDAGYVNGQYALLDYSSVTMDNWGLRPKASILHLTHATCAIEGQKIAKMNSAEFSNICTFSASTTARWEADNRPEAQTNRFS